MSKYKYLLCTATGQYEGKRFIFRIPKDTDMNFSYNPYNVFMRSRDGRWILSDGSGYTIRNAKEVVELTENEVDLMSMNI